MRVVVVSHPPEPERLFMVASAAYLMAAIKKFGAKPLFIESPWRLWPWNGFCWRKFQRGDYRSRAHTHSLWTYYLNHWDLIRVVISTKHDPFNPFLNPECLSILRRPALVCQRNKCLNAYPPYARAHGLAWQNNHLKQQWKNIQKCFRTFMSDVFLIFSLLLLCETQPSDARLSVLSECAL